MDQVLARCAINFFLSDNVLGLCQIAIARRNRLSHSADLRPHAAFSGSVLYPTLVVLAKSFLGAGCIWHISGGRGSRVEDRVGVCQFFSGRVVWQSMSHLSRVDLQSAQCYL
jgi:hypothetical protein